MCCACGGGRFPESIGYDCQVEAKMIERWDATQSSWTDMSIDTWTQPTSYWLDFNMAQASQNLNIVAAIAASDNILPTTNVSYTLRTAYGVSTSMYGEEGWWYDEFVVNVNKDCSDFLWSQTTDSAQVDLEINVHANSEGEIVFLPFPINGPDATWEACAATPTYTLEY
jgi:hypothetical protein